MKTTLPLLILALAAYSSSAEENSIKGELVFPDGDAFPGIPAGVSEEGFLLWKSPLFMKDKGSFLTTEVDTIKLSGQRPAKKNKTVATITFQNRVDKAFDVMEADLLGFDDESVKLRTWYAGDLTLKRSMLHMIEVSTESPAIIDGPGRIDEWQTLESASAWRIDGRNLVSSARGSIARELPQLPDQIHIEFDLFFDYSPYLRLHLFADSGDEIIPRTGYSISIQRGTMQFLKKVDNRSVPIQMDHFGRRHDFQEDDRTHAELFVDRTKGKFHLYLDDELVSASTDPEPLTEDHWFHLATLRGLEQTISNFAIRAWDGKLPERRDFLDFRQELPMQGEQIELQNGDTIIGKATSISEGKLKINTEYVPVSVPIERLSSFQVTSKENREEPRLYRGDVRAYFHHGGHVTLQLKGFTETSITGYSQVFGNATFELQAFTHIEFNPYDPEFRARRGLPF
ncbi:MAG: hypothetical protein ACSHYB_04785 [Roseibacillus sp.]